MSDDASFMKQYEYKTVDGQRLSDEALTALGAEGWRVVHMYSYEFYEDTYWNYTFIREKQGGR